MPAFFAGQPAGGVPSAPAGVLSGRPPGRADSTVQGLRIDRSDSHHMTRATAPKFEERPECREAVGALREPGVSQAAILDCLDTLYSQYGREEAWTTIKAQNYKKVRELLEGKQSKKAKLMDTDGAKSGPSEAQLAEAEVLCDLMAVPLEYLRRVLAEIYQNYGGLPGVWDLIKGSDQDPDGLWAEVIKYIDQDPTRPSPPAQVSFELPFDWPPQPSGGSVPSRGTTSPRRPTHSETGNHPERSSSHSSAEPLKRAARPLSPRGHTNGLHRKGGLPEPVPSATPDQQAVIDDVTRQAARIVSPHGLRSPHLSDIVSPSLRGEPALPSHPPDPQSSNGPLLDSTPNSVGATSGRWEKHRRGAQLLESTSSLPQHASLVKKSQEATEESQRKRRRALEHQAELPAKAGALRPGQQSVDGAASADVPERREGSGAEKAFDKAGAGPQAVSAGGSKRMEVERDVCGNSAGLRSPTRGPEGSRGGALEQALKKLHEVGSSQPGGLERPGYNGGQQAGVERGGATLGEPFLGGRNEADDSVALRREGLSLENRKADGLESAAHRGGELSRKVANGEVMLQRKSEEQPLGVRAGSVESNALLSRENHALAPAQEARGADAGEGSGFGMEEEGGRRKLKRIRKVGETTPAVRTTVMVEREIKPAEKRFVEKQSGREAGDKGYGGDEKGAVGVGIEEPAKANKEIWGPGMESKPRTSKHKSLNAIVKASDKKKRDEKKGPHKAGRVEERRAAPLADVRCIAIKDEGVERGTGVHATGDNGLKKWQGGVGATALVEGEGTGAGAERVVSEDVSRGLERHKIRCVNGVNDEGLPKGFRYMRESRVYEDAQPHAPSCLALLPDNAQCDCEGNCLDAEVPCGCTVDTRGCYAYNKNGCLDGAFLQKQMDMMFCPGVCLTQKAKMKPEERLTQTVPPCEGHRMFIKECSIKCLCHTSCGNRVVQRGIAVKLEVFWAVGKGWAVRCLQDLPAGTFVCEYVGEILTTDELDTRNRALGNEKKHFPTELNACPVTEDCIDNKTGLCLDATKLGNVARFFNHRCEDATLIDVPVEIEGPKHNYYHLAFFTNCFVEAGTELTWDYGIDFEDENHPIKAFECHCGSALCGGKLTAMQPGL
ncbi:putative histone H3 (Lys9) methyltransferase SUV39H1/Clr4 [Klebsormidium nitens]|uniref:Putative histone H3 (Lys9) methyltransferase SUV39H1/Clr4 n=1 Tax=Klebsormidium nitens TaxID=105231 RepID=A0A1Y1I3B6_KLENI|nr:putative histone H3 (Lys9) methyltransferase SUV39H1/Clr4 [Klebsormidium nitens]|eukprot:GAQ83226.1 putative histone H3 (Lys9) methyltransferase SUV39H1/Clr4 [Klebsormidium nitens]